MAWNTNVLVGQSGGPTAAINASLAGVFDTARDLGAHVLGMRYGIEGFLAGRVVHLDRALGDHMDVELLRRTPASYLGSCRFKLPEPEDDPAFFENAFFQFEAARVGCVLYIGGNDSMDTIDKLSRWGQDHGSDVRLIGIPKTIDNDLVGTDHTPGYGSAAKFIATSMREIERDSSVYDLKSVTFVEIMGRDAGWLAGSACLAGELGKPCPDLVLLPEVTLNQEALLERLARLLERPGRLARLRIVDHDELRADRPAVRLLVLHAAYASRYARHADEDSGRGRSANRRKDDLVRSPGDPRPLALVELSRAAVCDSLEAGYRVAHLREVGGEMLVHLELGLDRVEDLERGGLGRSHHDHELAVAVQHRPDGCRLGERRLA
jgi:6-phosphofructokinase